MPLMPKRVKYRKTQRGSRKGTASRNLRIDFGEFGLQTLERAWITNTQLEAARVALTRNMKRKGKLWIRIFPDKSVTSRPPETRMGKGKGQPEPWVPTWRELKLCSRNARRRPKSKFYGRTKSTIDCSTAAAACVRDPQLAKDPHRRSDFERYEQNDCSKDGHARATSEVRKNRQPEEKVLCA